MGQKYGKQQHDQHIPKGKEENKKTKQSSLRLFFLLSLFLTSCFFFALRAFSSSSSSSLLAFFGDTEIAASYNNHTGNSRYQHSSPCSSLSDGSICCDRTSYHSDICFMSGDIRTHSRSSSVVLYPPSNVTTTDRNAEERIRPYPRKWEGIVMDRISELRLRTAGPRDATRSCDVRHDVPAIFFSAGGYAGNVFHAFNDALLPLYITSHHLRRRVVLVVLNYHHWWFTKYREVLAGISGYPPIDFSNDTRTHCFPGAIAGLRFHGTLAIDPAKLSDKTTTVQNFRRMLKEAYEPRTKEAEPTRDREPGERKLRGPPPPKLVVVSRTGTRVMENEGEVVQLAKGVGFDVEVLRPTDRMPMARIYASLSKCDVMMGVHGAALTHFLFMRPGSTLIQIVPLGVAEVARTCYGGPAASAGLRYAEYAALPRESSLSKKYGEDDVVVRDPERVKGDEGWEVTKKVYLEGQNVTLDTRRLENTLARVFRIVVSPSSSSKERH